MPCVQQLMEEMQCKEKSLRVLDQSPLDCVLYRDHFKALVQNAEVSIHGRRNSPGETTATAMVLGGGAVDTGNLMETPGVDFGLNFGVGGLGLGLGFGGITETPPGGGGGSNRRRHR